MTTKLKQYFPMLRTREELLTEIREKPKLFKTFQRWKNSQQEEFLDFCTGVRGIKFLYDSFFKEIMNPEYAPERLEELLSLILQTKVKILDVLPVDSTRIADESALLTMDIVVQLEDGAIVNLEIQKIGYKFPGERSACYSADLLLRQYKRVRGKQKEHFRYNDIKGVYTIVLFESSPKAFHYSQEVYCHRACQVFDTELEMELLQKYVFIALDIFKQKLQNGDRKFENKLEAWLTFLSVDDPDTILSLLEAYPEFGALYNDGYQLCLNIEEVMDMFSKELAVLDRNTVQLMIDEMQQEIEVKKKFLEEQTQQLEEQTQQLEEQTQQLEEQTQQLEEKDRKLEEQKQQLEEQTRLLEQEQAEKAQLLRELQQLKSTRITNR